MVRRRKDIEREDGKQDKDASGDSEMEDRKWLEISWLSTLGKKGDKDNGS